MKTHNTVFIFFVALMLAIPAYAQNTKYIIMEGQPVPKSAEKYKQFFQSDPVFEAVRYLKQLPPETRRERIERLVHGVSIDLPPEYDYYGYEIRRFMASVGGPMVLASQNNISGQLQNINTAQKIAHEWQVEVMTEVKNIEDSFEEKEPTSSERGLFKFNKGTVIAFFVELNSWLNNNERALSFLRDVGEEGFTFEDPVFRFASNRDLKRFQNIYKAQYQSLVQLHKYPPFRMMMY